MVTISGVEMVITAKNRFLSVVNIPDDTKEGKMSNILSPRLGKILISLAMMAILLLGLCISLDASATVTLPAPTAGEPVTLVFWHLYTGASASALDQLIAEFNTTNEYSITVQAYRLQAATARCPTRC